MKPQQQSENQEKGMPRGSGIWLAFFVLIAVLVYSPWVAPYGRYELFILGMPFTVFWRMFLSLVLLSSIVLFVIFAWSGDEQEGEEK